MAVYADHALKLTYDDLKQIPEDDPFRHEICDGMHVATPSPIVPHQQVVGELFHQLYSAIHRTRLGRVFTAPLDVELGRFDVVEPDIVVVLHRNLDIITESHIVGVPDLLVEVLSPSTASRDRGIKRARYELAAVPEYWIVDPVERGVDVLRFDLSARGFMLAERCSETVRYDAAGATIDVAALFE